MHTPTLTHTWHPLTLTEGMRYRRYTEAEASPSADFSFAAVYMWDETYRQSVAYGGERAMVRITGDGPLRYAYPVGRGAFSPLLTPLIAAARTENAPLIITGVPATALPAITHEFPDIFHAESHRHYADYLYDAASLATLSGKKLHQKRNHCNAFAAAHDFFLTTITPENRAACLSIAAAWAANADGSDSVNAEQAAIRRGLDAFEELGLFGALLIVAGQPVAFTVGEFLTPTIFCVRFEKALPGWSTAYPVINRAFVQDLCRRFPDLVTVNREDDMGLENLRRAKLSYRPVALFEKYTLTLQ